MHIQIGNMWKVGFHLEGGSESLNVQASINACPKEQRPRVFISSSAVGKRLPALLETIPPLEEI